MSLETPEEIVNKFLGNLIEEVGTLRNLKMEYDTIWRILEEKYGVNYRSMWDQLQGEAMLRFKLLWQEGDYILDLPLDRRPTEEHWKLLTRIMALEGGDDMGSCTQDAEHALLCLLVEAAADVTSRDHLPLWHVIEHRYNAALHFPKKKKKKERRGQLNDRSRACPAVLLQRRFVRWLANMRAALLSRWRCLLLAAQGSEPALYLPAVIRYSELIASGRCQWSRFLDDGLVVDSSNFEAPSKQMLASLKRKKKKSSKIINKDEDTVHSKKKPPVSKFNTQNDSSDDSHASNLIYKDGYIIHPKKKQPVIKLNTQNDSSDDNQASNVIYKDGYIIHPKKKQPVIKLNTQNDSSDDNQASNVIYKDGYIIHPKKKQPVIKLNTQNDNSDDSQTSNVIYKDGYIVHPKKKPPISKLNTLNDSSDDSQASNIICKDGYIVHPKKKSPVSKLNTQNDSSDDSQASNIIYKDGYIVHPKKKPPASKLNTQNDSSDDSQASNIIYKDGYIVHPKKKPPVNKLNTQNDSSDDSQASNIIYKDGYIVHPKKKPPVSKLNTQNDSSDDSQASNVIYKDGYIVHQKKKWPISQLDGQNDSSDDDILYDSNSDCSSDDVDSDNESDAGINEKQEDSFEESVMSETKDETEIEEIQPQVLPDDSEHKPIINSDFLNHITIPDIDRGQPIPTPYLKLILSSINKPCMLITCCLSRRLSLLKDQGCLISDHVGLGCSCCCAFFGNKAVEQSLTIFPLIGKSLSKYSYKFITPSRTIEGLITPATEFSSVCHICADTFVNNYDSETRLLSLEASIVYKIDRFLIVTSSRLRGIAVDLHRLYSLGDANKPIRKITGNINSISCLIVKDKIDSILEANTIFCRIRNRKDYRIYKTYIPLPAKYLTTQQSGDLYDLYLIDVSTGETIPVNGVYWPKGMLTVFKTNGTPDMVDWRKNSELRKRMKRPVIQKELDIKTFSLTGELFPGPKQKISGVTTLSDSKRDKARLKELDRVLDLHSLNYLPKLLPHENMPSLSTTLSAANRRLVPLVSSFIEEEHPGVESERSGRVKDAQKYRIRW